MKTTDTLDKYFPKASKDKKKVTIDHLLHHTSGLDPKLGVPYDWGGARDQYAEQMLAPALVDVPGEKWSYSNVGYALLAAIVEVVTNGSFEDYCRKELFAPARLEETGFVQDRDLIKSDRITKRKCDDGLPSWSAADWHYGWGYRGMGGVVSTAPDLLAWDRALRGTKILGEAAKKKLYTPTLEKYACGWIVDPGERGGTKVSHSGSVAGYRMQFARWLEDDLVVIVLPNDKEDPYAVEREVTAAYLANK
jgi:CubicO group peptidase (beta-lactamase class C family)